MIPADILNKVKTGAKVRVFEAGTSAPFEGLVIARKHGKEIGGTFTVRTMLAGVGVEKVYPLNSPIIKKIEVVLSPRKVHRSKIYWVRKASGAEIRKKVGVAV